MRYKRLSLLLVISLVFFLVVSLILICTWFYYYFYDREKKAANKVPATDIAVQYHTKDSIHKTYSTSIANFDATSKENGDSLRADFNNKLTEFYKLRNEITGMLSNRNTPGDLDIARQKISTLQQKIEELRSRTQKVEFENKRLNVLLQQLSHDLKGQELQVKRNGGTTSVNISNKLSPAAVFMVSDINLAALETVEDKDLETSASEKVEKLVGSFMVRNYSTQGNGNEIMVVVVQPDGRVFQNSSWESGTFDTREGKKIYSAKIVFDYTRGESKRLTFSIRGDDFQKGEYTVQIYQNGMTIAKGSKRLL